MSAYYSLDRILRYDVPYRLIIGERSNGKTYGVKKRCFYNFVKNGKKFLYIRKRTDSISRKEMKKLWADANEDYIIDELGDFIKYTPDKGFYYERDDEYITIGYVLSVEDYESKKGIPYNDISIIFFDEFIEKRGDLDDEVSKFMNLVSTVRRKRDDVEIFMVANTVTRFSPYFEEFGIDIKKLHQGEISYIKHEMGAELAIEYCRSLNKEHGIRKKDRYFGFDHSPASQMIMYGEWEYDVVNTKSVDGITWNCNRRLVPMYLTALGEVYEMSIYENGDCPISFVRKINTQNGVVKKYIRYNLSVDDSLNLVKMGENGKMKVVSKFAVVNNLMDKEVVEMWNVIKLCIEAKRTVFDNMHTGSDFSRLAKEL